MDKHTPGPWAYLNEGPKEVRLKRDHWSVGAVESREGVAIVFRDEANARLIATAPEMLSELQRLAEHFGWQSDHPACQVIAKATGAQRSGSNV